MKDKATCLICKRKFLPSNHSAGKFCSQTCYQSQPKARVPIAERFWKSVKKGEGCWEWTGTVKGPGRNRYGVLTIATGSADVNRRITTHRFSWELHFGPIPDGLQVCHHCDNPPCVRPDHLFLGTNSDNQLDSYAKHRKTPPDNRGERHGMHKLTAEKVRELRDQYSSGYPMSVLADAYGMSLMATYNAIVRRSWKHVP